MTSDIVNNISSRTVQRNIREESQLVVVSHECMKISIGITEIPESNNEQIILELGPHV